MVSHVAREETEERCWGDNMWIRLVAGLRERVDRMCVRSVLKEEEKMIRNAG